MFISYLHGDTLVRVLLLCSLKRGKNNTDIFTLGGSGVKGSDSQFTV